MKIGIVVHSHTGNTASVGQRLKEKFIAGGHSVNILEVKASNDDQAQIDKINLTSIPVVDTYDVLIIGAPVRGFSLSPVLQAYLKKVESLRGKKVACYVTQHFPYKWMGGNRAIKQMRAICESKGANVCGTGIVNWSSKQREDMISRLVEEMSRLF